MALEDLWRERLQEAQRRYSLAKVACAKAAQECAGGLTPASDGRFALQMALRGEMTALAEYQRVLAIFHDLAVNRKLPPE